VVTANHSRILRRLFGISGRTLRPLLIAVTVRLALLGMLVQAMLPLADAAMHRHASRAAAPIAIGASADATATLARGDPAHLPHECALCAFIQTFGGATAPPVAYIAAPETGVASVAWPAAAAPVPSTAPFDAPPRAPPHRI
jgi:hypothetical protein